MYQEIWTFPLPRAVNDVRLLKKEKVYIYNVFGKTKILSEEKIDYSKGLVIAFWNLFRNEGTLWNK